MQLDRETLLKAVETVKPALATKELIEELCHVWLDGELLTAFNDATLGIQVPFKSELVGGIRGSLLLGMLTHSRAKEIEVEMPADGEALLKAGRTKLKLSLLAPDRAEGLWDLPDMTKAKGYLMPVAFVDALKAVMVSVGSASSSPEQIGITIVEKEGMHIIATDDKTVAMQYLLSGHSKGWPLRGKRVTIPTVFIEQLLKVADSATMLFISEDSVMAITGEKVKLFARLVDVPKPNDFVKICADSLKGLKPFPIPVRLKLALQRAAIMLDGQDEEAINVDVSGDVLRFFAKTPFGELKDSIKIEGEPPDCSCRLNPGLIQRALAQCDTIAFSEQTTAMQGQGFTYLISNYA